MGHMAKKRNEEKEEKEEEKESEERPLQKSQRPVNRRMTLVGHQEKGRRMKNPR